MSWSPIGESNCLDLKILMYAQCLSGGSRKLLDLQIIALRVAGAGVVQLVVQSSGTNPTIKRN